MSGPVKTIATIEKLREAIDQWLRDEAFDPVDWLTPEQWAARGEEYGRGAVLNAVMTDDEELSDMLNRMLGPVYASFVATHTNLGYSHELGYSWSIHFYPNED